VARGLAQGEHLGRSVREAWEVHDSHPAAVRALLRFIYTAKVPEMEENGMVVEVLKLADFFEVLELKAASKEEMIRAGRPGRHQGRRHRLHQGAREGGDGERRLEGLCQGPARADGGDPGGHGGAHGPALRVSPVFVLSICPVTI